MHTDGTGVRRFDAEGDAGHGALARARFADDPQGGARVECEGDGVDGRASGAVRCRVALGDPLDRQQCGRRRTAGCTGGRAGCWDRDAACRRRTRANYGRTARQAGSARRPRRDGSQQPLRVGVPGVLQDRLDAALLDDDAVPHHRDAIGQVRDDGEVVADHEHCCPRVLEAAEQAEDLRRDGGVQRRRRLVSDEEPRVRRDRGRDECPLAEAAGQLVRVLARADLRVRNADRGEEIDDALAAIRAVQLGVQAEHLTHLVPDGPQ